MVCAHILDVLKLSIIPSSNDDDKHLMCPQKVNISTFVMSTSSPCTYVSPPEETLFVIVVRYSFLCDLYSSRIFSCFPHFNGFFSGGVNNNGNNINRQRLNEALINEGYDISHNRYPEGYQEAPLAYDAVWSVALAFNKTMERLKERGRSLKDFTYTDKDIADEIYAAMNSTQFLGVSVSFGLR